MYGQTSQLTFFPYASWTGEISPPCTRNLPDCWSQSLASSWGNKTVLNNIYYGVLTIIICHWPIILKCMKVIGLKAPKRHSTVFIFSGSSVPLFWASSSSSRGRFLSGDTCAAITKLEIKFHGKLIPCDRVGLVECGAGVPLRAQYLVQPKRRIFIINAHAQNGRDVFAYNMWMQNSHSRRGAISASPHHFAGSRRKSRKVHHTLKLG